MRFFLLISLLVAFVMAAPLAESPASEHLGPRQYVPHVPSSSDSVSSSNRSMSRADELANIAKMLALQDAIAKQIQEYAKAIKLAA
jgi:hypothetical protein